MKAVQKYFLLMLLAVSSSVEAGSITGNLKLPSPYTQVGDMQIFVRAISTSTNDVRQALLTIPQAQANAGGLINFFIGGLNDNEDYRLDYTCQFFQFPEPCENIVTRANYLAPNQSVFRQAQSTILEGSIDHQNIQLPIMVGNTISGTLNLPNGQTAPAGGIQSLIVLFTVNLPVSTLAVNSFIAEGQSSDDYQAMIPDDASETWEVGYICNACEDFLSVGYYNSLATNTTAELRIDAEDLPGNQNSSDIDLTLLNGHTISGTLSVPNAPTEAEGIQITMSARDDNDLTNNVSQAITIAQGATSAPFELLIPLEESADWRIRYECQNLLTPIECNKYIRVGYFDSDVVNTMTNASFFEADVLPGGQSYSGINFSLISGFAISGRLRLSDGVAPAGGIRFSVSARNTSGSGGLVTSQVEIEANQREASYQINVDTDPSKLWQVSFNCNEIFTSICLEIADMGYYDAVSGNTVDDSNNAMSLVGGMNHSDINLVVESPVLAQEMCFPIRAVNGSIAVVCL